MFVTKGFICVLPAHSALFVPAGRSWWSYLSSPVCFLPCELFLLELCHSCPQMCWGLPPLHFVYGFRSKALLAMYLSDLFISCGQSNPKPFSFFSAVPVATLLDSKAPYCIGPYQSGHTLTISYYTNGKQWLTRSNVTHLKEWYYLTQ